MLTQSAGRTQDLEEALRRHRGVQSWAPAAPVPTTSGIRVATLTRSGIAVSGSFCTFLQPQNQPFTCIVGDVEGHGQAAAMLVGMTSATIRGAISTAPAGTPASLLYYVSEALFEDFREQELAASLFLGRFDMATRQLYFAAAGRLLMAYVPSYGIVRPLEPDGAALGAWPLRPPLNHALALNPGDLLVIASAGLGSQSGREGRGPRARDLTRLIEQVGPEPVHVLAERIMAAAVEMDGGGRPETDQTLVVIKGVVY